MQKELSEKRQIFIGSIISYASLVLNILIAIFFTPFLLSKVGNVDYGIRNFALSFVTYATVFGTGIASAYLRFANLAKNKHGEEGVKDVDGVFLKIFIVLGAIILFVGLILSILFYLKVIPLKKYTDEQIFVISFIVFLSFFIVGFKLPFSLFVLILNFKKRFIFRNLRYLLASIFEYAFCTLFLLLGITVFKSKIIPLTIISFASELIFGLAPLFFLLKKYKYRLHFKINVIEKSVYKDILAFSLLSLLIVAVMSLNDATDKIILGFLSPMYVTIYSLTVIFNGYIRTFADTLTVSFTPRITEAATNNDINKVQSNFNFVSKITTLLLCLIVFGYVACGREFIILWLGSEREIVYYYSIPLLVGMIFLYPQHFSIQIHRAYGKQKFTAIILGLSFIFNVILSISLIYIFMNILSPVLACVIGTFTTYVLETIVLSIYNQKKMNLKQLNTLVIILINVLLSAAISLPTTLLIGLLNLKLIYSLLLKGAVFATIYLLIQYFINKKEVHMLFNQLFKRKKNEEI